MNALTSVLRFRAPAELVDRVQHEAQSLNLDRSAFLRLIVTQKLGKAPLADKGPSA